ncbi:17593_t:CDS:1, partial [Gigaspora rosea]
MEFYLSFIVTAFLHRLSEDIEEYIPVLVIQFAEDSDLLKYLTKNFDKMRWLKDKLPILANNANGLKIILEEGLTHRGLHYRNILINNNISHISDFGLSHPF